MSLKPSIERVGSLLGAILVFAGVVLVVVGVMRWPGDGLAVYSIARPAGAMTATAVGDGGAKPTHYEAGYSALEDDLNSYSVPTTPTVYLEPVATTSDGAPAGFEPAWWKVWWDPKAQTKAVVSLQQHLTAADASEAAAELNTHLLVPAHFGFTTYQYALTSKSRVPNSGDIIDYLWSGTATDGTGDTVSVRLAGFSVGRQTAVVTLSTSGSLASEGRFDQLVIDQRGAMTLRTTSQKLFVGCGVLVLVAGLALIGASVLVPRRVQRLRRAGHLGTGESPMAPLGYRIFAPEKATVVLLEVEGPVERDPDGQDSPPPEPSVSKLSQLPPPIDGSLARPAAVAKSDAVRDQPALPHPPPFRVVDTSASHTAGTSDQPGADGLLRGPRKPSERLPWDLGRVDDIDVGSEAENPGEPEEVDPTPAPNRSGGEEPWLSGGIERAEVESAPVEAGWYTDPSSTEDRLRYWSGSSWTDHLAVKADGE